MIDAGGIDWKAVGAIAGPALAALSLFLHLTERRPRRILRVSYSLKRIGGGYDQEGMPTQLLAQVRIINPRATTATIVERVELLMRDDRSRWKRPAPIRWHREILQVAPTSEEPLDLVYSNLEGRHQVRVRIKVRGRMRRMSSPWHLVEQITGPSLGGLLRERSKA